VTTWPIELKKHIPLKVFMRFLLVGGLNTAVGYGIFAALTLTGFGPESSLLVATVIGVIFNFFTTGRLVFSDRHAKRFSRYVLVYLCVYLLNVGALRMLLLVGVGSLIGQLLVLPLNVVVTFLAMRTFVFQEQTK
jgi:putative flippase GtrA